MDEGYLFGDAYQPSQIARRVESMGMAKARADALTLLVLAVLAGAYWLAYLRAPDKPDDRPS